MQEVKPDANRNHPAEQLALISTCQWVGKAENMLITVPTGVGKTHLEGFPENSYALNY